MQDMQTIPIANKSIYNVDKTQCAACELLSETYTTKRHYERVCIEDDFFEGSYAKTEAQGLRLDIVDMHIKRDLTMVGKVKNNEDHFTITCFYGGNMTWTAQDGNTFALGKNDLLISQSRPSGSSQMYAGQHIRCVELNIERKSPLLEHEIASSLDTYLGEVFMPFNVQTIVGDILDNCPRESLLGIYYQAKMLELYTLFASAVCEAQELYAKTILSLDWTKRLIRAKEIIDRNIAEAPSITELSRKVCLNEYKLKSGFKQLFGLPVHAYIIDKRLQKAMLLLKNGQYNVTEAAMHVGYSELGRFAGTFRKKFGINPSEIIKNN